MMKVMKTDYVAHEAVQLRAVTLDEVKPILGQYWAQVVGVENWNQLYIDENNKPKIHGICQWIAGDTIYGKYDHKKGFYLFGHNDSGKTDLLRAIHLTLKYIDLNYNNRSRPYKRLQYADAKSHIEHKNSLSLLDLHRTSHIEIDDLGYGESLGAIHSFIKGGKKSVVVEWIGKRERLHKHKKKLTHTSSNHDLEAIEKIYGKGTSSRIKRMCNIIKWEGGSIPDILKKRSS